MADVGEEKRTNQKHQNSIKLYLLDWKWQKKTLCTSKHTKQQNEYYSIYSLRFLQKIFRGNPLCNHLHLQK